jgi:hypothetical protein
MTRQSVVFHPFKNFSLLLEKIHNHLLTVMKLGVREFILELGHSVCITLTKTPLEVILSELYSTSILASVLMLI